MSYDELPRDPSLADPLPPDPLGILGRWLAEAREREVQPNPSAMALATVGADGAPSLRVVLCRGYAPEPGYLVFHTNRESRKGRELAASPRAAAVFHWDALARQVRVEGPVVPSPDDESDAYFASRPRPAQVAAWASRQSEPIASRAALLARLAETDARFDADAPVPRPPHWGGYRLHLARVELWVGSAGRAHDRGLWERALEPTDDGLRAGAWRRARLQP